MASADSRYLTQKEKEKILTGIDKISKNQVEKVLENIKVPPRLSLKVLNRIKKRIDSFLEKDLPRKLTKDEIKEIVDVIPLVPCPVREIALENNKAIKRRISLQLSQCRFSVKKETISTIKKIIYEKFLRSISQPGDSVGSTGVMAIAEQMTQANLDAVHSSGAKNENASTYNNVTDLINIPEPGDILTYTAHFKNKNIVAEEIKSLENIIRGISVGDLVQKSYIMESLPPEDKIFYKNFMIIMGEKYPEKQLEKKFLRLELNINKCVQYGIGVTEIINVISANTADQDFDKTVICIGSSLKKGIIDVHGTDDYIRYSVAKFSNIGERLKNCPSANFKNSGEDVDDKTIDNLDINEMSGIFLSVIIKECLCSMKIKGLDGVISVVPSKTIDMDMTFDQSEIYSENDIEKFSSKPYNMSYDKLERLWNISIKKDYIYYHGIPPSKCRDMFKVCGLEIIEDNLDEESHSAVVMMPYERKDKRIDDVTGTEKLIYKRVDGRLYNNITNDFEKGKELGPKMLIGNFRDYEKRLLSYKIKNLVKNPEENFSDMLPEFSEIYRKTGYCHAKITGKKIASDLFSNKLFDRRYIYPENPKSVLSLFGIEGARSYLVEKYLTVDLMREISPSNVYLLIDFQTSFGELIAIKSLQIYKKGDSALAAASFEKMMDVFRESSAFGESDKITSAGSRVVTGNPCKNGTGMVSVSFDKSYIMDEKNKTSFEDEDEDDSVPLTDDILGSCENPGLYILPKGGIRATEADNAPILSDSGKTPIGGFKESIPSPPRMTAPDFLKNKSEKISFKGPVVDIDTIEEIPSAPVFNEDDFF